MDNSYNIYIIYSTGTIHTYLNVGVHASVNVLGTCIYSMSIYSTYIYLCIYMYILPWYLLLAKWLHVQAFLAEIILVWLLDERWPYPSNFTLFELGHICQVNQSRSYTLGKY